MSIVADELRPPSSPSGTWSIDPVWSALEFEVKKLGLVTVKGRVPGFTGTIEGGDEPSDRGRRRRLEHHDLRRDPRRPPAVARLLRHRAVSRSFGSSRPSVEPDGDELVVEGDLTIKGVTKPVELTGSFVGAGNDPWGNERIGIELAGTVDRTDFGLELERAAPRRRLPPPERGRPQGELRGGQGGLTMRILAISGSLRAGSYNTALARAAARPRSRRASRSSSSTASAIAPALRRRPRPARTSDRRPSRDLREQHRRGGRAPRRHAGVQRLDHRAS